MRGARIPFGAFGGVEEKVELFRGVVMKDVETIQREVKEMDEQRRLDILERDMKLEAKRKRRESGENAQGVSGSWDRGNNRYDRSGSVYQTRFQAHSNSTFVW